MIKPIIIAIPRLIKPKVKYSFTFTVLFNFTIANWTNAGIRKKSQENSKPTSHLKLANIRMIDMINTITFMFISSMSIYFIVVLSITNFQTIFNNGMEESEAVNLRLPKNLDYQKIKACHPYHHSRNAKLLSF